MKRFLSTIGLVALLTGLAGCGGESGSEVNTKSVDEQACADALKEILQGKGSMVRPSQCEGISDDRMGELSFHGSPEAADAAAEKE